MESKEYNSLRPLAKKAAILRGYICSSLVFSLLGFVYFLITAANAFELEDPNLSWVRLVVPGILGISTVVFLLLCGFVFREKSSQRIEDALSNWLSASGKPKASLALVLSGFVFGAILLVSSTNPGEATLHYFFSWLRPFSWWLVLLTTATLIVLFIWGEDDLYAKPGPVLLLILILLAGIAFHVRIQPPVGYLSGGREDVYFTYQEGQRLAAGENPYARVLSGNMRENDKYATYLPAFFCASVVVQALGFDGFTLWVGFWRPVFLLCNLGIGALLYYRFWRSDRLILATFASLFWLFNRWTVKVSWITDIDFIALFFLILSLFLWSRHRIGSLLLIGLSLAVKQMALFVVPLYVIWEWHTSDTRSLRTIARTVLLIGVIPALVSLPFLVWNWEGFIRSILFSATRNPTTVGAMSADAVLGWVGLTAKAPLLLLMVAIYWASLRQMIPPLFSVLLVMAAFVSFNSVFFSSYTLWIIPFILLATSEAMGPGKGEKRDEPYTEPGDSPQWLVWTTLILIVGLALALRWHYVQEISLFIDEYRTVWAARQVLLHGLPIFPSGDFYPHGFLFTYLEVPFVLGDFNESVARIPGLLVSLLTIPVVYWIGRRLFSERVGLITAAALAVDPDCIIWGGRARMYGLLQLLTILIVYLYYRGLAEDRARYRYLAMGLVGAAVFTQAEAGLLLPALGVATVVVLPWRRLFRWSVILPFILGGAGLGLYFLASRLGRPGYEAALQQSRPYFDFSTLLQAGPQALASAFADLPRLPFALLALAGLYFVFRPRFDRRASLTYLYVVLLGILVPFALFAGLTYQSDRYLFFLLPLLYLICGEILSRIVDLIPSFRPTRPWQPALLALLVILFVGLTGTAMAYEPELGYDLAFRYLRDELQPAEEDRIVTQMTTPAMLYLGRNDAWAIQRGHEPYVVAHPESGLPVDRWTATPALTSTDSFRQLLATAPRVWFITDHWSFQVRYDADFVLTVLDQMDLVYDRGGVLIFRGEGTAPSPEPRILREHRLEFGEELVLTAFGLSEGNPHPGDEVEVTLYWQALEQAGPTYTVSLQLVGPDGIGVAGVEEPILGGLYQPDLWPKDTVIIDPHQFVLPPDLLPGRYRLGLSVYSSAPSDSLLLAGGGDRAPLVSMTVGEISVPSPTSGADVTFEGQIRLLGHDVACEQDFSGCDLRLYWEALTPVDRDYTVFVHLLDANGAIIAQDDAPPGDPFFPTSTWLVGEVIVDDHHLALPAAAPPGVYHVIVGLYHWPTGERLQAVDGEDNPMGDAALLTSIDVE